jgi:hypothetical protein
VTGHPWRTLSSAHHHPRHDDGAEVPILGSDTGREQRLDAGIPVANVP